MEVTCFMDQLTASGFAAGRETFFIKIFQTWIYITFPFYNATIWVQFRFVAQNFAYSLHYRSNTIHQL